MTFTKNDQYFDLPHPPPFAKMNNGSLIQKHYNSQASDNFKNVPLLRSLFSHLFWDRSLLPILPKTYSKLTRIDKTSKTCLKPVIKQNEIYQQLE